MLLGFHISKFHNVAEGIDQYLVDMVDLLCLLFQDTVLLLDVDVLFLDHHLELHLVLKPADRIADYLLHDVGLVGLCDVADDPVLIALSLHLVGVVTRDHNERDPVEDRFVLQVLKHGEAVHHRHQIVEQDDCDGGDMVL